MQPASTSPARPAGTDSRPVLVWFRLDLRLADHPALTAAVASGRPVVPVFICAPEEEQPWAPGAASNWWLHQSLLSLSRSLAERGSRLILRRGPTERALRDLVTATGASAVFWNRRYEPACIERDATLKRSLTQLGLECRSFNGALLHEPWTIATQSGTPFQVFSAFWRQCLSQPDPHPPLPAPAQLPAPQKWPPSLKLAELTLEPTIDWTAGLRAAWHSGETAALEKIAAFTQTRFAGYRENRDRPDLPATSRLSPHLHFGEITPRQIWHACAQFALQRNDPTWRTHQFLTEIGWREFSHYLLYHFPTTHDRPLRPEFEAFPWNSNPDAFNAWKRGRTGFPIVDAGMRELWTTGWMHNRVRMIVASFLVKDLLIPWQEGARWFWDTLVDADLAQNTLGWQWTAGCGADAAPYFRVFNPTLQGEKFDPSGAYVRRWCPELSNLPDAAIHEPARATTATLRNAGIALGRNYPQPVVSHEIARNVALAAFAKLKSLRPAPSGPPARRDPPVPD